jgi:hypothetical protein
MYGLEPNAWKRLEQWGFDTLDYFVDDAAGMPIALVEYANLLYRLDAAEPPPELFTQLAVHIAAAGADDLCARSFAAIPDWFMRALLRETECTDDEDGERLFDEVREALVWLRDCDPHPDSNQRKAGWAWIVAHASEHAIRLEAHKWDVPCAEHLTGAYRIVAIRSRAELRDEAVAMKNCLDTYADKCAKEDFVVFSIRRADNGMRVACFTVVRKRHLLECGWVVQRIAGKMNSAAPAELVEIAADFAGTLEP